MSSPNPTLTFLDFPSESPTIDISVLEELSATIGDEFMVEIVQTYLNYAPNQLETFKQAIHGMDMDVLRQVAHGLKSSSRSVGAQYLGQVCEGMETLIREGQVQALPDLMPQLEQEYNRAIAALQQFL